MTLAFTWYVFDVLCTIAFALSGALVGLSKKMDVFGVIVLAVLTAVGGGMVRDVLIDSMPTVLVNTTNLLLQHHSSHQLAVRYLLLYMPPSCASSYLTKRTTQCVLRRCWLV